MTPNGWAQIALILALVTATAVPLGRFIAAVAEGRMRALAPFERGLYAASGVDPSRGMGWRAYTLAMLAFNAAGFLLLYALLRLQGVLPLNPQGVAGMSPWLAFNTAVSFVTNTNWQAYSGEAALSYLSQMAGLTTQNFLSASTGIALALAFSRAFAAGSVKDLGSFWADLVRITLYLLLPLALVLGLLLVAPPALHCIILVEDIPLKVHDDVKVFGLWNVQEDRLRGSGCIKRLIALVFADRVPGEHDE